MKKTIIKIKDLAVERNRDVFSSYITEIMNTLEFGKLADKTQVIISLSGPNVRTRLTHTIDVAKIAKDICYRLGLNEELAEAIALGHDIGHTPFGHVGERTLYEITCGCDTLENRVDFCHTNSGFKHNLQSFMILNDVFSKKIESNDHDKLYYILWGVAAHSKMSWAKLGSGEHNEILIHSSHCSKVYDCQFSVQQNKLKDFAPRPCKYNGRRYLLNNNNLGLKIEKPICFPWYCANLIDKEKKENVNEGDDWNITYCFKKCYFAKIWEHRIKNKEAYNNFDFLFDHPFPNTYYSDYFNERFSKDNKDFVSLESIIVAEADEIAQRKQDIEDGLNQKLIDVEDCIERLKEIFTDCEKESRNNLFPEIVTNFIMELDDIQRRYSKKIRNEIIKEIGQKIVDFLSKSFIKNIEYNFSHFVNKPKTKKINDITCYNLFDLLYSGNIMSLNHEEWLKNKILSELNKFETDLINGKYDALKAYFKFSKRSINKDNRDNYLLYKIAEYTDHILKFEKPEEALVKFKGLNILFNEISNTYSIEIDKILKKIDKKVPEGIILLFNFPLKIFKIWRKGNPNFIYREDCTLGEYRKLYEIQQIKSYDKIEIFEIWKKEFKSQANQILSHHLSFDRSKHADTKFSDNLEELKDYLKNTILKSEIVEKNDGKASYIIRRLFEAYLTNPHQLPDETLIKIFKKFNDKYFIEPNYLEIIIGGYKELLKELNGKLFEYLEPRKLARISDWNKCISDDQLIEYPKEFIELYNSKEKLKKSMFKIKISTNEKRSAQKEISEYRNIIDNPIFISLYYWKRALIRGICNYISNLTDREALSEYEKLYFGVMELG